MPSTSTFYKLSAVDVSIHNELQIMINHLMSDYLLYQAARDGKVEELKDLLSKGAGTGYEDKVI